MVLIIGYADDVILTELLLRDQTLTQNCLNVKYQLTVILFCEMWLHIKGS